MNEYEFTKEQAVAVARHLIVGYWESHNNADQDAERLACRLTGALEIFVLPSDVENAFNWLDDLARLADNTHDMLVVNAAGTLDNSAELADYFESELTTAINDVVSSFKTRYELAA
ncbi:hypothetical protein [Arthrobacter sp. B3I4]|uniref:hypothetical protein n=1 Tax=Arthrobacter sp. B3I4 TaxID=3042267 RepID=UPI002787C3B3|nr:hypothetical protein [Arthrobacter sp. B3I4]MDQ0756119.1 uncharacterized protein Smg (DUF494 family) [Arthrobacter sp. B3I4]